MTNTESGVKKEFVDKKNRELTVKLINFLDYVPFSTASDTYEPLIIITYILDDGTEIKISTGNTETFFNGNGHQLKGAEIFGNLTKAVFFSEETVRESAQQGEGNERNSFGTKYNIYNPNLCRSCLCPL